MILLLTRGRNGTTFGIIVDGILIGSITGITSAIGRTSSLSSGNTGDLFIGHAEYDSSTPKWSGYMDEFAFYVGTGTIRSYKFRHSSKF